MTQVLKVAGRFVRDEEGASLAEYGLLLALIAIICIAGMSLLGGAINTIFSTVGNTI